MSEHEEIRRKWPKLAAHIEQQAQELERVTKELNHQTRQRAYGIEESLKLEQQLAASQARVKELEERATNAEIGLGFISAREKDRVSQLERDKEQAIFALGQLEEKYLQLQATLAAREARIIELERAVRSYELTKAALPEGELNAWRKFTEGLQVDLDAARQDAARLREALHAVMQTCRLESVPTEVEQQAHTALKGA